jgi:hypothetical protein
MMLCLCHAGFKVICQRRGEHVNLQCRREAMWSGGVISTCLETNYFHVHSRVSFIMKMKEKVPLKHIMKT